MKICVKTFGSKPGGGRLIKGGGRRMHEDTVAASEPKASAARRGPALMADTEAVHQPDGDMICCENCGRTFNKEAGERHMKICVKTFGSKPGGSRLTKGGGSTVA